MITDKITRTLNVYINIYDDERNDLLLVSGDIDVEVDVYIEKECKIPIFAYCDHNNVISDILENAEVNLIESKTKLIREMLYEELDDMDFESTGDSYLNIEMCVSEL